MKIFITGATGYIGHQLALTLADGGYPVNILVRDALSPNIPKHKNITAFIGDVTDPQSIKPAINGCTQVYHTAAVVKMFARNPSVFYKVNVEGTRNLLEAALESGVKKFVYTSTCAVIGSTVSKPKTEKDARTESFVSDYDFTKFLGEILVKEYSNKGLFTVIASVSKVYGPGIETHPVSVNTVISNFLKGKITFIPKPGSIVSNYCYINDIVEGHILAMNKGQSGEKYILSGDNLSFTDFFGELRKISGSRSKIIEAPKIFVKSWAIFQWVTFLLTRKEPFVTDSAIHHIYTNKIFSNEKARLNLGYQTTPIQEALTQTIQFLNSRQHA